MYNEYTDINAVTITTEPQLLLDFYSHKHRKAESQHRPLKVASLFSGCGGLDLGFVGNFDFRNRHFGSTRFKITYSNDIDSAAEHVYNANSSFFNNHKLQQDDIRNVDSKSIPDFDFLLAGFPCQPFSNAGLRKGINDERGNLFEECECLLKDALLREHKPVGFVFENVKGILSSKMENGVSIPDEIVKRTEQLGFKTCYKLLKTSVIP
jgi:DNA (cytosine-5)-methyltransferase 1